MNKTTEQIARYIAEYYHSCSLAEAFAIQQKLDVDFSRCSRKQLENAIDSYIESISLSSK